MALIDTGLASLFQMFRMDVANATILLDAASEVASWVGPVKAGTITHMHFRSVAVTVSGTVDCRLETVLATGLADGTLLGTTSNGTQALIATTDDNKWWRVALTTPLVVTDAQLVTALVANPATSFGTMTLLQSLELSAVTTRLPYRLGALRSAKQVGPAAILLEYADGSFTHYLGYLPFLRVPQITLDTGQSPNEAGVYFTPDVPMRLDGYAGILTVAAGADYAIKVYQVGNNTPLASTGTRDGDQVSGTTVGFYYDLFTSMPVLAAGTSYRLAVHPQTTGDVILQSVEAPTAGAIAGLTSCSPQWTERTRSVTSDPDTAVWTQTSTRLPSLWPLLSALNDGAGAGGGLLRAGGMTGGMHQS